MKQFAILILTLVCCFTLQAQTTNFLGESEFISESVAIATGNNGTVLRSNSAGLSWTNQPTGLSGNILGVCFFDPNTGLVAVAATLGGSSIYKTTNGGTSYTYKTSSTSNIQAISCIGTNFAVAVGNNGTVLRTTDGGETWISQTSGTTVNLYDVDFVDQNIGTAVGASGTVLRTTNGGINWTSQSSGIIYYLRAVHFVNSNVGNAVGDQGNIIRTTNGGATWVKQSCPVSSLILYGVYFTDANNGTAVGQAGTILRTTNGGTTWTNQSQGLTLASVSFCNASTGIIVGELGTILRTTNGGVSWTQVAPTSDPPSSPTLLSPINGASGQATTLTLSWNSCSGATSYRLQVSNSSTFSTLIVDDATLTGTSKQVGPLSNSTTYYWRVSASNVNGTSSYSTVWSFTTTSGAPAIPLAPMLLSPANGAIDQSVTPTLSWNASSGTTSYRLQVSNSSTFSTLIVDDGTLTGTSKQVGPLSNSTTYYWRVSASNVSGTSSYSTVWSFTTLPLPPAAPTLLSPSNGALNQPATLTLSWNSLSGATSYRLQVSTNSAFSSTVLDVTQSGTTKQVGPLLNSTLYYWRVSASNSGGTSAYSSVWNFTVLAAQVTSPVFNVDKKSIDFGSVTVGTKKTDSVVVSNTGNSDLIISSIVSTNSKYTLTPTTVTVTPGASRKVYITFAPNRKIVYPGKIVFTHNAANVRDTVNVTGTGIGAVKTTRALIITSDQIGIPQVQSFKVYNEGETPLEISNIGSTNDAFSTNVKTAIVEPANSFQVSITAIPKSAKKEKGYIVIQYSGADDLDSLEVELDVVLSVKQNDANYPGSFALHQNYPNPFNPTTRIAVDLPAGGQARLVIYNILGEQVATLMDGIYAPGSYDIAWSGQDSFGSQVPSGLYFYKLDAGELTFTKKMQLMK